ncbi:MAG: hypothetical protein PHF84_06415 [bacterium]|nr:hypothetical protein [bacterium]
MIVKFLNEEDGQFLTEYALVTVGILFIAISSFQLVIRAYKSGYEKFLTNLVWILNLQLLK